MTVLHQAGKNEDGSSRKEFWPPCEGTATLPPEETNPLLKLFIGVSDSQESILQDHLLLTNRINLHRCSDYCLRKPHSSARYNERKKYAEWSLVPRNHQVEFDEIHLVL